MCYTISKNNVIIKDQTLLMKKINKFKKVYISTGGIKKVKILDLIKLFTREKIYDLELSGGEKISKNDYKKLINLSKIDGFNLRPHNYFPPPKKKFVINLASEDKKIISMSIKQIKQSILLTKQMKGKYFSFHAGFRIDPKPKNLGKKFKYFQLLDRNIALRLFKRNLLKINKYAKKNKIKILVENNVITKKNLELFRDNPLLLTNPKEIISFFKSIPKDIGLLLDVGHLKVSAKSEKFNLEKAIMKLNKFTKGYHLSENNSYEDQNKPFAKNAWFYKYLKKNLNYYTIEAYTKNINILFKLKNDLEKHIN